MLYACGRMVTVQGRRSKCVEVHNATQADTYNASDGSEASQTYSDGDHKTGKVSEVASASAASGPQRCSDSTITTTSPSSEREKCVVRSVTAADGTSEIKVNTHKLELMFSDQGNRIKVIADIKDAAKEVHTDRFLTCIWLQECSVAAEQGGGCVLMSWATAQKASNHQKRAEVITSAHHGSQVFYSCRRTVMAQGRRRKHAEVHKATQASAIKAYDGSEANQTNLDIDHEVSVVSGVASASTANGTQCGSGSTISTQCPSSVHEQHMVRTITIADCTRETKVNAHEIKIEVLNHRKRIIVIADITNASKEVHTDCFLTCIFLQKYSTAAEQS